MRRIGRVTQTERHASTRRRLKSDAPVNRYGTCTRRQKTRRQTGLSGQRQVRQTGTQDPPGEIRKHTRIPLFRQPARVQTEQPKRSTLGRSPSIMKLVYRVTTGRQPRNPTGPIASNKITRAPIARRGMSHQRIMVHLFLDARRLFFKFGDFCKFSRSGALRGIVLTKKNETIIKTR